MNAPAKVCAQILDELMQNEVAARERFMHSSVGEVRPLIDAYMRALGARTYFQSYYCAPAAASALMRQA